MAIENRTGRPTVVQDNPGSKRIDNGCHGLEPDLGTGTADLHR
jgi:hypothetical protein